MLYHCFIKHTFFKVFFFSSAIWAIIGSCYNRGESSLSLHSVRISSFCFSKRNDLRSCLSQVGNSLVLTDTGRTDTARTMHALPPTLCLGFPHWPPRQSFLIDGWWHEATRGVLFCMCLSIFVTVSHTCEHMAFTFHSYKNKVQTRERECAFMCVQVEKMR